MNIFKFPDKFKGEDDFHKAISEYNKLSWRIIPFIWFLILAVLFLFYNQKEIIKPVYGILGAILVASGTPIQPRQIVELSESCWNFNPNIAKAYLRNIIFVAIGLFLVIVSLIV